MALAANRSGTNETALSRNGAASPKPAMARPPTVGPMSLAERAAVALRVTASVSSCAWHEPREERLAHGRIERADRRLEGDLEVQVPELGRARWR